MSRLGKSKFSAGENDSASARSYFPWAFVGSIALLIGFDIALRVTHWPRVMPYDTGLYEYYAAEASLDVGDPAEVAFVGSSRTRESIHLPTLKAILAKSAGRPVSAASYALSRARAYDFEMVVRRLLREKHPPRVIVVGISERDLARGIDDTFDTSPVFWNFADWHAAWKERGAPVVPQLPIVVRNEIGEVWRTLQLREPLRLRATQLVRGEKVDAMPSPLRGEATPFQTFDKNKVLNLKITPEKIAEYVRAQRLSPFPNDEMLACLDKLIAECRAANVTLILYEPPVPKIYRDALPRGVYKQFVSLVTSAAQKSGVQFIRAGDLNLAFGRMDFREQSHMNLTGATAFTKAFGTNVIARSFAAAGDKKRKHRPTTGIAPASALTSAPATRPSAP